MIKLINEDELITKLKRTGKGVWPSEGKYMQKHLAGCSNLIYTVLIPGM